MASEKRLIDANAIHYCNYDLDNYHSFCAVTDDEIAEMPTVDAVEVVHGRWNIDKSFMPFISTCSECGAFYDIDGAFEWSYCPNCGAKMDGDGNV